MNQYFKSQNQLKNKQQHIDDVLKKYLDAENKADKLQSDLTRMRETQLNERACVQRILDILYYDSKAVELLTFYLNNPVLSDSSKEETNKDPKSKRMAGVDKIYSCLSDIQRATPMPYNDSNEIIAELLKIKDSLIKIKSL